MFWGVYHKFIYLLRPFASFGLNLFSGLVSTKRARVFIYRDQSVLLVRDIFSGDRWCMPGGGVERNELASMAASREVLEEVGLYIEPKELNLLGKVKRLSIKDLTYNAILYSYQTESEISLSVNKWEIVEARWFKLFSLPKERTALVDEALRLLRQSQKADIMSEVVYEIFK